MRFIALFLIVMAFVNFLCVYTGIQNGTEFWPINAVIGGVALVVGIVSLAKD